MPSQHKDADKPLLTQAAESIGATLGAIAAKASELPAVFSKAEPVRKAKRSGKKAVKKTKAKLKSAKRSAKAKVKKVKKVKAKGKKSVAKAKARVKGKSQRRRS
jgi:hypothetical protein